MPINLTLTDLVDACGARGCPICNILRHTTERYIKNVFDESILDPGLRRSLRESLGLCHEHAWLTQEAGLSDALGLAIVYHDLIGSLLERKPTANFEPSKPCPACRNEAENQERLVEVLAKSLHKDQLLQALKRSDGFCLHHLRMVLGRTKDNVAVDSLLAIHEEKWKSLQGELSEFVRKNDHRFRDESFGAERDSYKRAIADIVGMNRRRRKFE
jgi:hypothetical protein